MSKLGYFLGGAVAGIAGLAAAALLHDHLSYSSSGSSLPSAEDAGDAKSSSEPEAEASACESTASEEAEAASFCVDEPTMPEGTEPATA
ncbi:MAG: hypothetical protein LBT59_21295 [Clostridiales bacterium]|jgi:hypothetical protein|nr:hypothetical protein [Clostridiales bacterium]